MADCLFCKIVEGKIPARKLLEDDQCVAFHDINGQAPVHVLVVPRRHIGSLDELSAADDALMGALMRKAAQVAKELNVADDGYRTVVNTGANAGQTVFHIHVHVMGGRALGWPPG